MLKIIIFGGTLGELFICEQIFEEKKTIYLAYLTRRLFFLKKIVRKRITSRGYHQK
jgi:hypothetical protein